MLRHAQALAASLVVVALLGAVAIQAANINLTDKLLENIKKKDFDAFVKELQMDPMDVNQPDSKGRLALVEAVRTKDIKFVDAVLQYGALAKSKDPATGASPLHVAFQQNQVAIAKMLLSYGADPNAEDKGGKKAREFTPSKELRDLVAAYDKSGAMAFEDAPGTWIRDSKDSNKPYWFNTQTRDSRWNTPPSCAWHRQEVQGHPVKYVNSVTGQETTSVPTALAWTRLRKDGKEIYYNWKVNMSQFEKPHEPPKEVMEIIDGQINVRWFNEKTNEYSWENPSYKTSWRELKDESSGHTYWFNVESGESTWDQPTDLAWTKMDHESGTPYFFNKVTGESTWEAPDHMSWVRHDSDL